MEKDKKVLKTNPKLRYLPNFKRILIISSNYIFLQLKGHLYYTNIRCTFRTIAFNENKHINQKLSYLPGTHEAMKRKVRFLLDRQNSRQLSLKYKSRNRLKAIKAIATMSQVTVITQKIMIILQPILPNGRVSLKYNIP